MDLLQDKKNKEILSKYYKNKKIMVSGSTGLIGSRIVYFLDKLNYEYNTNISIVCLYKDIEKRNKIFADIKNKKLLEYVYFDAERDFEYCEECDAIFQCAGISGGSKMHLTNPIKIFDIGYIGTKKLLDYAVTHSVKKFLFVSSYEIYGNSIDFEDRILETSPSYLNTMELRNVYAEVKRVCESLCVAYSNKYGIEIFSGRLTSTFGEGVKYDDPRFFSEFVRCYLENKNIILKSKGLTVRSYLDSDDAASAFLFILAYGKNREAYNVTNMNNIISIIDIAHKIASLPNSKTKIIIDINSESVTSYRKEGKTLIDSNKLINLGWAPVWSLDETINKLVVSMKS